MREFYKAVLKGTKADNPGDDEGLEAMRASIVRIVGRKSRHVPKVSSGVLGSRHAWRGAV